MSTLYSLVYVSIKWSNTSQCFETIIIRKIYLFYLKKFNICDVIEQNESKLARIDAVLCSTKMAIFFKPQVQFWWDFHQNISLKGRHTIRLKTRLNDIMQLLWRQMRYNMNGYVECNSVTKWLRNAYILTGSRYGYHAWVFIWFEWWSCWSWFKTQKRYPVDMVIIG